MQTLMTNLTPREIWLRNRKLFPIFIDTETHRIGPGAVVPKLVCASIDSEDGTELWAIKDRALESIFDDLFTAGNGKLLVFHHAAFDVPVIYRAFPRLQAKIWEKICAFEITDTMLREQLLNLGTIGKLEMFTAPDGSTKRLLYSLDSLVLKYTGEDISESKKGEDAWRLNFALLEHLHAAQFPKGARDYAMDDVRWTGVVYQLQDEAIDAANASDLVRFSVDSAAFHAAAAIALAFVTERGMATDPDAFAALNKLLRDELSDKNMQPLIDSAIMEKSAPALPYKPDEKKARAFLAQLLNTLPEEIDFENLNEVDYQKMVEAGIRIKAPTKASIKTKQLKRYVVAALIAKQNGGAGDLSSAIDALLSGFKTVEELEALAEQAGVKLPRTDTEGISTAAEVITEVAGLHPVLTTYRKRQKLMKLVTTEVPRMMWDGKLAPVVHFPFKAILETGRTSSSATDKYPSANGQNVDPRARAVFRPREGYVLCSCDYSALELVCVAETTLRMFGRSVHYDLIEEGKDLHAYLGTRLAIELSSPEFLAKMAEDHIDFDDWTGAYNRFVSLGDKDPIYKFWRKLAKPVGLGFPSGLGPATMVELAEGEPYNIPMKDLAAARFKAHPDEFDLKKMAFYGRKLHGMTRETLEWTPQLLAVSFATRLRNVWLSVYPEMENYFAKVKEMKDPSGDLYFMDKAQQKKYEEHMADWLDGNGDLANCDQPDPEDYGGTPLLRYETPMGMYRARCSYTAVSNGLSMQSPGAEGAKMATILAVRACIDPASMSLLARGGGFVVDFIHDELLVEIKAEDAAILGKRADVLRLLMEEGLSRYVIRTVPVKANPALMRQWNKTASPRPDPKLLWTIDEPAPAKAVVSV